MSTHTHTPVVPKALITDARHNANAKAVFGFWIYIMSDCLLFASLFAVFAVLRGNTFGGAPLHTLFQMPFVLTETVILLTSSFTYGLVMLAAHRQKKVLTLGALLLTALLGATFLFMEVNEFAHLVQEGHSWRESGALSAFFGLVGTHGMHIAIGLLWMIVLMIQVAGRGLTHVTLRKLTCLSLFWHFLDIIWIFIFSVVYLIGAVG